LGIRYDVTEITEENKMITEWINIGTATARDFTCGYCGKDIASEKEYSAKIHTGHIGVHIFICPRCKKPTFFDENAKQIPGMVHGNQVNDIPDTSVKQLYEEARNCMSTNSFTAVVFCCRKLLMNVAVSKGAQPGKQFIEYVEYLSENNYIPRDAKEWVDHIRTKGNEANHEIAIMKEEDAKDLLSFSEMLLKVIYEFPANIKKKILIK